MLPKHLLLQRLVPLQHGQCISRTHLRKIRSPNNPSIRHTGSRGGPFCTTPSQPSVGDTSATLSLSLSIGKRLSQLRILRACHWHRCTRGICGCFRLDQGFKLRIQDTPNAFAVPGDPRATFQNVFLGRSLHTHPENKLKLREDSRIFFRQMFPSHEAPPV